jgi:hypothetical protein
MVFGMATTKITISLPDEQLEGIRALVAAGAAASVSAFVKHAVGVALFGAAGWKEMLGESLRQTGGPLNMKRTGSWTLRGSPVPLYCPTRVRVISTPLGRKGRDFP